MTIVNWQDIPHTIMNFEYSHEKPNDPYGEYSEGLYFKVYIDNTKHKLVCFSNSFFLKGDVGLLYTGNILDEIIIVNYLLKFKFEFDSFYFYEYQKLS